VKDRRLARHVAVSSQHQKGGYRCSSNVVSAHWLPADGSARRRAPPEIARRGRACGVSGSPVRIPLFLWCVNRRLSTTARATLHGRHSTGARRSGISTAMKRIVPRTRLYARLTSCRAGWGCRPHPTDGGPSKRVLPDGVRDGVPGAGDILLRPRAFGAIDLDQPASRAFELGYVVYRTQR
jgi:hypothetical protein